MSEAIKDGCYFGVAEAMSRHSLCHRRKSGIVIIKKGEIIATGYNGDILCANCDACFDDQVISDFEKSTSRIDLADCSVYLVEFKLKDTPEETKNKHCRVCERITPKWNNRTK